MQKLVAKKEMQISDMEEQLLLLKQELQEKDAGDLKSKNRIKELEKENSEVKEQLMI